MTTVDQRVDQLGLTLVSILTELRHIRADLAERTASVSSTELKQTSKEVALTVKAYAQSPVPLDDAISEFGRGMRELQRLQSTNWVETLDGTRAERLSGET